jgi:hypothetical protein
VLPLLALVAFALPASVGAQGTAKSSPLFYVGGDDHLAGQRNDLYFDLLELSSAGQPARIVISSPAGYRVSPAYRPGFYFGEADVYTSKGIYSGEIDVAPKAVFLEDPGVPGCAAGAHASDWLMLLKGPKGRLTVPVAADRTATGVKLTVCLGLFNRLGLRIEEVYFETRSVFRNPARDGFYRFSAHVVPVGTSGGPLPAARYELRGDEPIPENVTLSGASYDRTTHLLTIAGSVTADAKPRVGINVHVFTGQSSAVDSMDEVGIAVTAGGGGYTYTRKMLIPPVYVLAHVRHYEYDRCDGRSSAPGGCVSETVDGATSAAVRVKVSV